MVLFFIWFDEIAGIEPNTVRIWEVLHLKISWYTNLSELNALYKFYDGNKNAWNDANKILYYLHNDETTDGNNIVRNCFSYQINIVEIARIKRVFYVF